jgi:hypothetical protein
MTHTILHWELYVIGIHSYYYLTRALPFMLAYPVESCGIPKKNSWKLFIPQSR